MMLSLQDRIDHYSRISGFPNALSIGEDGRIVGTWVMGNDYRVKNGYHGGYPPTYLRRVAALFPDRRKTLHLFSGKVDLEAFPGDTVDINPNLDPTYVDDAETLKTVPLESYDLVLADPPYTKADASIYGVKMPDRRKVMRALERLPAGAFVVWLDQTFPMFRKQAFEIVGLIGMWRSTNHKIRGITIFEKKP